MSTGGTNGTNGLQQDDDRYRVNRIELIMSLRSRGIRDTRVLRAIERVPRHLFVEQTFTEQAYADNALPIECGQTISQPYIVAYMSEQLRLDDRMKVLEVGTGSGYQAAVLSYLVRRVYTIERYRTLAQAAEARFALLNITNITTMTGDGMRGWPAQAPFDRIIVTAAGEEAPQALLDQIKDGGIMIMPIGKPGEMQHLVRFERKGDAIETKTLIAVRFVPLVAGVARQL